MKLRWKILIGIVTAIVVFFLAGFVWMLNMPKDPARIVDAGPTGVRVVQGRVYGNFYPSPLPGRHPAVLLLGGSEGGLGRDVKREALLLQQAGFNVLQAAYFNAPGKPSHLDRVPLETFFDALNWLKAHREVDETSIGIVGYSKGAEAALLVASNYPGIKAAVAGMPSSVAWNAMTVRSYLFGGVSSWTLAGRQLPSLAYGSGDGAKILLPRFVNALKGLNEHPDTIIPIERFGGDLLLVCGGADTLWPSCPMADQIKARADAAGHPRTTLLRYPDAGHGVMGAPLAADSRDMRGWAHLGGTPQANANARADSWPKIVAFLREKLPA